jgi:hypothetical protein
MVSRLFSVALLVVFLVACGGVGWLGLRLLESRIAADVYRERLVELGESYERVRELYNAAVLETAVTELLVQDGSVQVSVRTAEGVLQTIPTPFNPERELYVDYVVLNDRLWIRRVFDEATAPDRGVVIDPKLVNVDWSDEGASHGKAAYRKLEPGRWVVTVTGDGALGLARRDGAETIALSGPPPVRKYPQIHETVDEELTRLGARDVFEVLFRRNGN